MIRIKNLSCPLLSTLLVSAALPAQAQVSLALSSQKSYLQNKKSIDFQAGRFDIQFADGSAVYVRGCSSFFYYRPTLGCPLGSTAFVTYGTLDNADITLPYLSVSAIQQALVVTPRMPDAVRLTAAPASKLPRPQGGFADNSLSLYFNLHTNSIREYNLTGYYSTRGYTSRSKFESEIVTGVYHYSFPRLLNPALPANISAVIYPMIEGEAKINKKLTGFKYTNVNNNVWTPEGFVALSAIRPNVIKWSGLNPSVVFPAVDHLYLSIRGLQNPADPNSQVIRGDTAIFPPFDNNSDPRVLLPNSLVSTFTLPPIFQSGTSGMLELEMQRDFQTGGVTYDYSTRFFQIPVKVIDTYADYQKIYFAKTKKNTGILQDADGDGYNNLTEWILNSIATDATRIPVPPVPALVTTAEDIFGFPLADYFGFDVNVKTGTLPAVKYTLERSTDDGNTWAEFVTDAQWSVDLVQTQAPNTVITNTIEVRSLVTANVNGFLTPVQPPGTIGHRYRVIITLL